MSGYTLDEFIALTEAIEAEGGELLPETHEPRYSKSRDSKGREITLRLAGCSRDALFEIPYRSYVDDRDNTVKVCAVDDMVGLWPRFNGAMA